MSHEDELSRWSEDFRADEPAAVLSTVDEIVAQSRRDDRRRLFDWASQIFGLLFAVLVFGWLVVRTRAPLLAGFAAFVLPVLLALTGFSFYLRLDEGRPPSSSVRAQVARAVRHRLVRHRVARASFVALVVLCTGFWMWLPFWLLHRIDRIAAEPWRLVIAVSASLLVFGGTFVFMMRTMKTAREELARWRAIASALDDE